MTFKMNRLALAAAALVLSASAQAQMGSQLAVNDTVGRTPTTGNTSAPSNWRFAPGQVFNGVAGALDGVAQLSFSNSQGNWACSGSLLQGGQYVLTAAHCADDYTSMTVEFGWYAGSAAVTRTVAVGASTVHPLWNGTLDTGADIAIMKLNAPVTTIAGYKLSNTNDVGKVHLMAGYGTTQDANVNAGTNWNDWQYGHYAYNTFDVISQDFGAAVWGDPASYYAPGATYMVDFDNGTAQQNILQRVNDMVGGTWSSGTGLGANEGLIAGGDSGGGDFVWNGSEWLLSGVHSWGWQACGYFGLNCNTAPANPSSYGDLSGSTATFSHIGWINSVTAVPEPGSVALMLAGLAAIVGVSRRRTQRQA
jgi:hypothetical protein